MAQPYLTSAPMDEQEEYRRGRQTDAANAGLPRTRGGPSQALARQKYAQQFNRNLQQDQLQRQTQQRLGEIHQMNLKNNQTEQAEAKLETERLQDSYAGYYQRTFDANGETLPFNEFAALPPAARAKMVTESIGGNPLKRSYDDLVGKGVFSGTEEDFSNMSESDRSGLIKMASIPKGYMTNDEMRKEYNYSDYTKESVAKAEEFNDPLLLMPREAAWGSTPGENQIVNKDYMNAEIAATERYEKDMQPLREVQRQHAVLIEALNKGTGAGDMTAIFAYMKALDPRSTVREGEYKLVEQVGGIKEQWVNTINKWSSGEVLPAVAREQLADLSYQLMEITKGTRDSIRADRENTNKRYRFDDDAVMGTRKYDYDNIPKYNPSKPPAESTGGGTTSDDMFQGAKDKFSQYFTPTE